MKAKAFATMEKDNDLLKPFLIDEEANELKPVVRSSYLKNILQKSTMLWHNIKSGIKNTGSHIFHQYQSTLPSIRSLTSAFIPFYLVFVLFLIVLLLVIIVLLVNGLGTRYQFGNNMTPAADPIKEEAVPKNLTVSILQEAQKSEPFSEAMGNCFDKAIKEFVSEPQILKENAKMILECNGTRSEFVSGKGENSIEVFWVDGQTHYTVREANSQVYVARLGRRELPLSLGSLLKVSQQLASLEGQEELQQCLDKVIEKFPKEPQTLQDNAMLQVSCGGSNVTFRSEAGTNEINVYKDTQGEIVYNVKARGRAWWDRLFIRS
ncbi:uncharacterized protein LOC116502908 isoform X2 [Thamnophis elegans]|uniref:uncharacterized protein LOC116502908 isoform X2 n=1 Tax=Thamnophis elegans TaxID=35005 RepID=UPI00137696B0|nr:uncharacterized protein LOC116502908 isoform X2 [Thamnophis elegans]